MAGHDDDELPCVDHVPLNEGAVGFLKVWLGFVNIITSEVC